MDFLTRLQDSFATLGEIVPALLGAIVILFAGYLLAKLTQRGVERLLKKLGVNELLRKGGGAIFGDFGGGAVDDAG